MPRKKSAQAEAVEVMAEPVDKDATERAPQTAIVLRQDESAVDVHPDIVRKKLESIRAFQDLIRSELKEGQDYGTIPGTPKPTLLKPGAEKIVKIMNLAEHIYVEDKIEDWETGLFYYRCKCELVSLLTNQVVATGVGSCNSKEDKYRWRWISEDYLTPVQKEQAQSAPFRIRRAYGKEFKVFRFPNDEVFTQVNTILKMAKKRCMIDAALSVGRLSNLFTQDIEDTGVGDESSFFSQSPTTKRESKSKGKAAEPKPEEEKFPVKVKDGPLQVTLKLTNGQTKAVSVSEAFNYFSALKEALHKKTGDDAMYYETLGQFGYEDKSEIPSDKIAGVWDTLVGVWKMYKDKADKEKKDE